jgi:hypothetical protein
LTRRKLKRTRIFTCKKMDQRGKKTKADKEDFTTLLASNSYFTADNTGHAI